MNICNASVRTAGDPLKSDFQIERDYINNVRLL